MDADPVHLGNGLGRDYKKAQKLFRQAMARQFVLGRELVDLRERHGAAAFQKWMERYCTEIPLKDAEALMNYSLTSRLAQKVDDVLDSAFSDE